MLKTVQRVYVKPKSPFALFLLPSTEEPCSIWCVFLETFWGTEEGKEKTQPQPTNHCYRARAGLADAPSATLLCKPRLSTRVCPSPAEGIPVAWRKYWQPLRLGSQDPGDICGDKVVASFTKALWGELPVLVKCSEILGEKVLNKPLSTAAPRGLGYLGINNSMESSSINIPISQIWLIWGQSLKLSFSSVGNWSAWVGD